MRTRNALRAHCVLDLLAHGGSDPKSPTEGRGAPTSSCTILHFRHEREGCVHRFVRRMSVSSHGSLSSVLCQ